MIDDAKLVPVVGSYRMATSGAITDATLLAVAAEYDQTVIQKIVALSSDDLKRRSVGDEEVLETVKYDGEGVFLYFERDRHCFAFNAPSGRARVGLPSLDAFRERMQGAGVQRCLLRAELCLPRQPGHARSGISDVLRISHKGTQSEVGELKLVILDAIMVDGKDLRPLQKDFRALWDLVGTLVGTDPDQLVHRMEGSFIRDCEVPAAFDRRVSEGEEGIVVRRLNRFDVLKIKPLRSLDAVVMGFVEGDFEGQYGVTSLLVGLVYPAGPEASEADGRLWIQTLVRVGSGLSDDLRCSLLDTLRMHVCEAPLDMTDSDGRPVRFVKPQIVAEVAGEDLVASPMRATEHRTQLFSWDPARGRFAFAGLLPFPKLIFPRFVRFREDKDFSRGGARIQQVNPALTRPEACPPAGTPELLDRRVFRKGEDMVRKLVVVRTGLGLGEPGYPFAVLWTDYSARRAEPLKVLTHVASSETRARALADQLVRENVTRGFECVTSAATPAPAPSAPASDIERTDPSPPETAPPSAEKPARAKKAKAPARPRAKKSSASPPEA